MVIPVHKKGPRMTCSNYRGVSLISVAGKWFGKVLNARLRTCTKGGVMEEQGCLGHREQLFSLRQVMGKAIERKEESSL